LQISGCELHTKAFGGTREAIALPRPPSRYKAEGREGMGRKGLGIGRWRKGKGGRDGKGKEGWERGGRARLGYLSRGHRVRSYATTSRCLHNPLVSYQQPIPQYRDPTIVLFSVSIWWLGSRVVSVLDSGAVGPRFKSQPRRCRVTVLGKLFTPIVPLFTKQRNS